jgi:hypothetical protein
MPSKKISHRLLIYLLVAVILIGTGSFYFFKENSSYAQLIAPPVPSADVPFTAYQMNADSGLLIEQPSGTRVRIYPGTIVYLNGQPVKGSIEVKVREFHTAFDILRSGIPMSLDARRSAHLQSAGMIEVRAFADGREVKLREGTGMDVELASFRSSKGYQLYYMNAQNKWAARDTFFTINNTRKQVRLKELELMSGRPFLGKDTTEDLIVELVTDTLEAPELIPFIGQQWAIPHEEVTDQVRNALRIHWDDVRVKAIDTRKMIYELEFSKKLYVNDDKEVDKSFTVQVRPIVDLKRRGQRRKAFAQQMEEYELLLTKVNAEKERLAREADFLNSFKMTQMGLCNIDRIMNMSEVVLIDVRFDFEKEVDSRFNKLKFYALYEGSNSYVSYQLNSGDKVAIDKIGRMSLIAVLPNGSMALAENQQIKSGISKNSSVLHLTTKRVNAAAYFKSNGSVQSVP